LAIYVVIIIMIFSLWPRISFAQQMPFVVRDNAILGTFQQLQGEKDKAIVAAFQEAQMQLLESGFKEAKVKHSLFEGIKLHPHPYVTWEAALDDNADNTINERKHSFSNRVLVGAKTNLRIKNMTTILDINLDHTHFHNRSRSNINGGQANLQNYFNIGRYTFSLSDALYNTYTASEDWVEDDVFQRYWSNTLSATLSRDFNRLGFSAGYSRVDYRYEDDYKEASDRSDETYTFNQYLKIGAKTRFLLDYEHGRTIYRYTLPTLKDYNYDDLSLGITGILSAKLGGLFQVGHRLADYKEDDDYKRTTFTTQISYMMSMNTDMSLSWEHRIHGPGNKTSSYNEDNIQFSGNRRLSFNPKFRFTYNGGVDYYRYAKWNNFIKHITKYTWGLGLVYSFREWVDLSFNYDNYQYKSNAEMSYKNNIFTFKTQAKF